MATGKIARWNVDGGFGWVRIGDKDWFVHYTAIVPQPKRGSDPTGTELVEVVTGQGKKGPAVTSAMTREEFDWREARRVAEEAEAAKREEEHCQYEADKAQLEAVWPELEPLVTRAVSQRLVEPVQLPHGAVLSLSGEYVREVSLDPVQGATVTFQQSFKLELGRAQRWPVEGATYSVLKGWDGVKMWGKFHNHLDRESGQLAVKFSAHSEEVTALFPATAQAPRVEGNKVVQVLTAQTPVGEATEELLLYANPSTGCPPVPVWGDFEITDLVSEVDTAAFKAAGISQMPKVEFKVADFRSGHRGASHGRDPDEGAWSEAAHEWFDGGAVLKVTGPFMAKLTLEPKATGVILTIAGALDRVHIEDELRKKITRAVKMWNLTAGTGQAYGEKLLAHLMGQIPEFKTMESLWEVDEKALKHGQLDGVPCGWAVVVGAGKSTYSTEDTRAVKVVAQATAEKFGLPGKAITGLVSVYWPEGQADTSVKEETVVEFANPPYPGGTQLVATIKERVVHHEASGRWGVYDSLESETVIPNTPGKKYRLTKRWEGGEEKIEKGFVADVLVDFVAIGSVKIEKSSPELHNGRYVVAFVEPRKHPWRWDILREAEPETGEPTMDASVYLGKSWSRDPSHVWVITADGKVLREATGEGRANFIGIPKSALVLRYQWSNYGYTYTEEWEVFYRPANLTEAQLATVEELRWTGEVNYFGSTGGWDEELRTGIICYSTPYYGKGFPAERKVLLDEMTARFPVDVTEYRQITVKPDPEMVEEGHPVLKWIEVGPEKK